MKKTYADDAEYIEAMMKRFKLVDMRLHYRDLILEAEASSMGYLGFLKRLLEVEEEGKTCRRTELLKKAAGFESVKRLEDIDYSFNPTLDRDRITELGNLKFIEIIPVAYFLPAGYFITGLIVVEPVVTYLNPATVI